MFHIPGPEVALVNFGSSRFFLITVCLVLHVDNRFFDEKIPQRWKEKKFLPRGISSRKFGLAEQRPISGRKGKQNNEDRQVNFIRLLLLGAMGPSVSLAAAATFKRKRIHFSPLGIFIQVKQS